MEKKGNVRIIDIARMAKVSVGTVDRVLHNRGRVSEEKRQQVEKVLKEINYKPNLVARFLASKRTYLFAVVIPAYSSGEYWELVSQGIDKAVKEQGAFNVDVDYHYFDQFDDTSFQKTIETLGKGDYAGVIIATLLRQQVIELSGKLDDRKVPYVFIDADLQGCNNLSYFGVDSYASGTVAAKLMMSNIALDDNILIGKAYYKHYSLSTQIENRELGFRNYLKEHGFQGQIISFDFNPTKKTKYIQKLGEVLNGLSGNVGAIVFNSRIYELVNLVQGLGDLDKEIRLIGYDPIHENVEALKEKKIEYLISQRSIQQGYESVRALSTHLIFNETIVKNNYMSIDILVKENVDFYND